MGIHVYIVSTYIIIVNGLASFFTNVVVLKTAYDNNGNNDTI
jgi:hypothetical protein